jgi:hypothetical protein
MTARPSPNGHRGELPHRPADWNALGYRPAEGTPSRTCTRCGARYLDDDPCRAAHITVIGHSPRTGLGGPSQPSEPASPTKETTP